MTNGYNKAKIEIAEKRMDKFEAKLDVIDCKIDDISRRLSFIYGGAAVIGAVSGFVVTIILRFIKFN